MILVVPKEDFHLKAWPELMDEMVQFAALSVAPHATLFEEGEDIVGGGLASNVIKGPNGVSYNVWVEWSFKVDKGDLVGGVTSFIVTDEQMPDEILDRINFYKDRSRNEHLLQVTTTSGEVKINVN